MSNSSSSSGVKTLLVTARIAAVWFALVILIGFGMAPPSPSFSVLRIFSHYIPMIMWFFAFLAFALLPRRVYAVNFVRRGVVLLSVLMIIQDVCILIFGKFQLPAAIFILIITGIFTLMAHEAHTWGR